MSIVTGIKTGDSKLFYLIGRIQAFFLRHPEWWAWLFCISAWLLLVMNAFVISEDKGDSSRVIYCMNTGMTVQQERPPYIIQGVQNGHPVFSSIWTMISGGLPSWMIMVVAMMFPLLNEPIRHVAFSVRRKNRNPGVLVFLFGYTLMWAIAGILFLLLPVLLDKVVGDQGFFVNGLIKTSGFLLAAILVWQPARAVKMAKCSQTMPIRIYGLQLLSDSFSYGLKTGRACLSICWPPMAALMFVHHNIVIMYVVTIVIIYERYLLPHTSKIPGYIWGLIAFTLLGIEIGIKFFN